MPERITNGLPRDAGFPEEGTAGMGLGLSLSLLVAAVLFQGTNTKRTVRENESKRCLF